MKNIDNLCLLKKNGLYEVIDVNLLPSVINVGKNERFECVFIQTNQDIHLKIMLNEAGASCDIKGVYLQASHQKHSLTVDITHAAAQTVSNQVVKGILTDAAQFLFSGVIRMPKDSQKCEGYQNHRAIVLSDKAQVQAVPELEIYADDVMCSHGSAIGPIDKNQLFYLQARGIDEKTAYQMLLFAYMGDVVPAEYHSVLQEWFDEHL